MWWHCNEVKERETEIDGIWSIIAHFYSFFISLSMKRYACERECTENLRCERVWKVKLRKIRKKSGMAAYWWWFDDKRHNGRILLLKVNPNREKNIHSNAHVILFLFFFIFITHLPLFSPYLFLSLFPFISLLPYSSHLLCPWGR